MRVSAKKAKSRKKSKSPSQEWSNIKGVKCDRLIIERKKRGLTQGQLASLMGVATATISHLENGRSKPGIDLALQLQDFYELSYEILFPDI
ncbi:helix-turn-helix transcriptional regulator [Paenibacillus glacialis]|uniref:HTH cro/C1-type domain-containing protein n=1 Tax=Paenibacillus glacialis TaxID=494026 RepID=A0A168DFZ7_9BACL|nr:helix-turn-helix transcriptional regulator [Paenibacillus glacialis]OAB34162.1 hypothetical protein PGLA_25035 [Paenibacillus glacialis]